MSVFIAAGLDQSNWKIVEFMVHFFFFKEAVWGCEQRDVNLIPFWETWKWNFIFSTTAYLGIFQLMKFTVGWNQFAKLNWGIRAFGGRLWDSEWAKYSSSLFFVFVFFRLCFLHLKMNDVCLNNLTWPLQIVGRFSAKMDIKYLPHCWCCCSVSAGY